MGETSALIELTKRVGRLEKLIVLAIVSNLPDFLRILTEWGWV